MRTAAAGTGEEGARAAAGSFGRFHGCAGLWGLSTGLAE